jgi:hypothetical protein
MDDKNIDYGHVINMHGLRNELYDIPRKLVEYADVVVANDIHTDNLTVFYGQGYVNQVLKTRKGKPALVVTVELDESSDDPEELRAIIESLKGPGSCDYKKNNQEK